MSGLCHVIVGIVTVCMFALGTNIASAEDYPTKPIHIVTNEPGGGGDVVVRILAEKISGPLGQPVIVDNRPNAVIAGEVARAKPDGYTLVSAGTDITFSPLFRKTDYDIVKDFAPITLVLSSPLVLVVNPSVPVKSVKELIAYAKANPGKLNYASTGTGAGSNLAAVMFKSMTGADIVGIGYKGTGPALIGLLSGETQIFFSPPGSLVPYIKDGTVRVLAIASLEPSRQFPDLPTVASTLPGFEISANSGLLAPAGTPKAIIDRLNQVLIQAISQPDIQEKLSSFGDVRVSTPDEYGAIIKSDITKIAKLIKDAGLKTER